MNRIALPILLLGAAVAVGGIPSPAQAQESGFYTERFEPMPTQGINLLNLGTSEVLGHMTPSFGLMLQYVHRPLQLISGDESEVLSRVIEHQARADLWFALGIANVLDVGVVIPFILAQSGGDLDIFNRPGDTLSGFAMSDIRLVPKLRILDRDKFGGFGLAVLATISLPTGKRSEFTSDGQVRAEPRVVLDWTDTDTGFSVVGNVGVHLRPRISAHNLLVDDALTWGLGLRVPTPLEELKLLGAVSGAVPFERNINPETGDPFSDLRSTPIELDIAAELSLGDFVTSIGAGFGLTRAFGTPDYRLFLTAGYVPRCPDRDGDGVCDPDDRCPDLPGPAERDGCPDPDSDGDGICDPWVSERGLLEEYAEICKGVDQCPYEPEDFDGFEDEDGCPDPDNDGDGICDPWVAEQGLLEKYAHICKGIDQCPNEPEDFDGFEDEDGCPDPDNDGDGICDPWVAEQGLLEKYAHICKGVDQCPNEPEDFDGFEDEDGCPDPDNDGDGEPDETDGPAIDPDYPGFGICRDAPGLNEAELIKLGFKPPWVWQGDASQPYPGCPLVIAECRCGQIIITQQVRFRYGRHALDPASFPLLDEVARVLNEKDCASLIRVEGHTDWHGPEAANDRLSQRRVDSVVSYLRRQGVEGARLQAKGYGERKPLHPDDPSRVCDRCTPGCTCEPGSAREPNPNEEEIRRLNRRVQFRILELRDPATGAVEQCPVDY